MSKIIKNIREMYQEGLKALKPQPGEQVITYDMGTFDGRLVIGVTSLPNTEPTNGGESQLDVIAPDMGDEGK